MDSHTVFTALTRNPPLQTILAVFVGLAIGWGMGQFSKQLTNKRPNWAYLLAVFLSVGGFSVAFGILATVR